MAISHPTKPQPTAHSPDCSGLLLPCQFKKTKNKWQNNERKAGLAV